ncbi:MAG TPA: hypothetical protein V6C97_12500 [Oculatellaceae cyanobacterium]
MVENNSAATSDKSDKDSPHKKIESPHRPEAAATTALQKDADLSKEQVPTAVKPKSVPEKFLDTLIIDSPYVAKAEDRSGDKVGQDKRTDPPPDHHESAVERAKALAGYLRNGDVDKLTTILETTTKSDRDQTAVEFKKLYGFSLAIVLRGLDQYESKLALHLLNRPDPHDATADTLDRLAFDAEQKCLSKTQEMHLLETVSTMTAGEIAELKKIKYKTVTGQEVPLYDFLHDRVSAATKDALDILSQGSGARESDPGLTRALAGVGIKYHDLDIVKLAMTSGSEEGRAEFLKYGATQPEVTKDISAQKLFEKGFDADLDRIKKIQKLSDSLGIHKDESAIRSDPDAFKTVSEKFEALKRDHPEKITPEQQKEFDELSKVETGMEQLRQRFGAQVADSLEGLVRQGNFEQPSRPSANPPKDDLQAIVEDLSTAKDATELLQKLKKLPPEFLRKYEEDTLFKGLANREMARGILQAASMAYMKRAVMQLLHRGTDTLPEAEVKVANDATIPQTTDPSKRDVILNAEKAFQSDEFKAYWNDKDKESRDKFRQLIETNLRAQLSPQEYERYIKPLLDGKSLSTDDRLSLYAKEDHAKLAADIKDWPPADRDAVGQALSGGGQKSELGRALKQQLSADEQQLVRNELDDLSKPGGTVSPENIVREHILGISNDTEGLQAMFDGMTAAEKAAAVQRYTDKYHSLMAADVLNTFKGSSGHALVLSMSDQFDGDRAKFEELLRAFDDSTGKGFSEWFSKTFVSAAGGKVTDSALVFAHYLQRISKYGAELPPDIRDTLVENMRKALDDFASSKKSTVDDVLDMAIAVVSVASASCSGGVSLLPLILAEGVTATYLKQQALGIDADKDQMLKDAIKFTVAAALTQPGAITVISHLMMGAGVGEQVAADTITALGKDMQLTAADSQTLEKKVTGLIHDALASGSTSIDEKAVRAIADSLAHGDQKLADELAANLGKELGVALAKEAKKWINVGRRAAATGAAVAGTNAVGTATSDALDGNWQALVADAMSAASSGLDLVTPVSFGVSAAFRIFSRPISAEIANCKTNLLPSFYSLVTKIRVFLKCCVLALFRRRVLV